VAGDDQEKTEEATDTRREEFRKRGEVVQTRELASTAFILFLGLGIFVLSSFFFNQINQAFQMAFGPEMVAAVRTSDYAKIISFSGEKLVLLLLPIMGIFFIVGVASSVVQIGFLQVEDALQPKLERINPISGLQRMFSMRSFVEAFKAMLKVLLIAVIVYFILKKEISLLPHLHDMQTQEVIKYVGTIVAKLLVSLGVTLTVITAADYFFQRWDLEKRMMMSKQEIKEEHKSREGDPLIKSRIRKIQRDLAQRRMMDQVKKADVVVTNPTHIAVALRYGDNLPAPQLLAKGADLIAERIRNIATENNIPIVENKPLARTIYKTMKLGQVIPRDLYVAVAEVLSYVYKLKRKKKNLS